MNSLNKFIECYDGIGVATSIISNSRFKSKNTDIIAGRLKNLESFDYDTLFDEIEENLYSYNDKELYFVNILKSFKYSCYLNEYYENSKTELKDTNLKIDAVHNLISNYQHGVYPTNTAEKYIIYCWEELSIFMMRLDELSKKHNIDFIEIQEKSNIDIWYRVKAGIVQKKDIKFDDYNLIVPFGVKYTPDQLKQIYEVVKSYIKGTGLTEWMDIMNGKVDRQINWTGRPGTLYSFIIYFSNYARPVKTKSGIVKASRDCLRKENGETTQPNTEEIRRVFLLKGSRIKELNRSHVRIYREEFDDIFNPINHIDSL